ncbi:MAG: TIM barrel protein, partial [Ginsengibacter sp.]
WKYTVEDAAVLGQEYVISPWLDASLRNNYDELLAFLDVFNKSGELCKKSGLKYGYHNHDFEFNVSLNNQQLYDIILEHTDPNLVAQQLDIGNMINGGGNATEILNKYPGRFELLHVKDEIKSATESAAHVYESTILGKGVINTKQVTDLAFKIGGTKHFIIEQESYQGKTPIECVEEDLKIMKNWGY